MNNIEQIKNNLIIKRAEYNKVCKDIEIKKVKLNNLKRQVINLEEANLIIQHVAHTTQKELEYEVSEIVTFALDAVFDDPYVFNIEFLPKKGKTEARLFFTRDGQEFTTKGTTGVGVVDIASFALRVACWRLSSPRSRNTIFLDEPFKHLSKEYRAKAAEMLTTLSKKIGLQFIMITHDDTDLIAAADKVFKLKLRRSKKTLGQPMSIIEVQ